MSKSSCQIIDGVPVEEYLIVCNGPRALDKCFWALAFYMRDHGVYFKYRESPLKILALGPTGEHHIRMCVEAEFDDCTRGFRGRVLTMKDVFDYLDKRKESRNDLQRKSED